MSKVYGLIALFDTPREICRAAEHTREAGYQNWDALAPFPVHGLDKAMGLKRSRVPMLSLAGGIVGFFTGMGISWYMGEYNYPLIVGGKPFFSPVFTFPIAYEMTILLAAFGAFFGQFIANRLPMLYHPVMNYDHFPALTDDRFAIVIESRDPLFDREKTRTFLEQLGGREIALVAE